MEMPLSCPYPRPQHPNPVTAEQISKDVEHAAKHEARPIYHLWDGERSVEIIIADCVYGFPSCVLVDRGIGFGVRADQWDCYGIKREKLDHAQDFQDMFTWIATKLTEKATGSHFAVGEFSDVTVEFRL